MKKAKKGLFLGLGAVGLILLGFSIPIQRQMVQVRKNQQLVAAIREGNVDQAIALVEAGANPDAPVESGRPSNPWQFLLWMFSSRRQQITLYPTAFYYANRRLSALSAGVRRVSDAEVARLDEVMIRHRASINVSSPIYPGDTALVIAIVRGRPETAKTLITCGVDINTIDDLECTPMVWALYKQDAPTALLLFQHHAAFKLRNPMRGEISLHFLMDSDRNLLLVKELLKHDVYINRRGLKGETELDRAKRNKAWGLVKILREHGAK